jgi:hypothetical protein
MAQQYPPPGYYYPPSSPYAHTSTSGWAIFSLIAGILAWLGVFGLGGIVAIISGYIAKNEINHSSGRIGGNGMATTGLVLGWLNIALACLGGCFVILLFTGVLAMPAFLNGIFPNGLPSN